MCENESETTTVDGTTLERRTLRVYRSLTSTEGRFSVGHSSFPGVRLSSGPRLRTVTGDSFEAPPRKGQFGTMSTSESEPSLGLGLLGRCDMRRTTGFF